ncbi:bifunctional endoribonuclease/protein kinase ire1 [Dimargaris verticillata]|uniref:Bifunctional endoribonuclease/protein kinase ire1 n=1 Tax=Dimargaris verticillata TaxID=2761393 RepID=A0A9W8B338_9FUNG|nr:bifunctional endoribonuclease/protein kinase ire1 [Dimargaris verticillata]
MGCVFYFFLTRGAHPFGEELLRDYHIVQGEPDFTAFYQDSSIDSPTEALDLVRSMVRAQPEERPTTAQVLQHPYFWNKEKRLEFMYKVSDCLRLKAKDPRSPLALALETQFDRIVGPNGDWFQMLDPPIQHSVREKRSFDSSRLQTLLTAIRNKGVHYSEASFKVKQIYGSYPDGYYDYFARRFPDFFMYIYDFARLHPELYEDDFLRQYFDG